MKRKSHFHFKKFSIHDDLCSMKVGTDSVVLGAWADIGDAQFILDIGAGSGVISLMMAQRSTSTTHIDGVELEANDAAQAAQNVLESPWPDKVSIHHTSIQEFESPYRYDVIISNPPYFVNSSPSPDKVRTQTRHTVSLDYETLLSALRRYLTNNGKANVILPATEGEQFIALAREKGFCTSRYVVFRTRPEKPAERLLVELRFTETSTEYGEVVLYIQGTAWSSDYKKLVQDFYLASY